MTTVKCCPTAWRTQASKGNLSQRQLPLVALHHDMRSQIVTIQPQHRPCYSGRRLWKDSYNR